MNQEVVYSILHKLIKRELEKKNLPFPFRISKEKFIRRRTNTKQRKFYIEFVYVKVIDGYNLGEFRRVFRKLYFKYLRGIDTSIDERLATIKFVTLNGKKILTPKLFNTLLIFDRLN